MIFLSVPNLKGNELKYITEANITRFSVLLASVILKYIIVFLEKEIARNRGTVFIITRNYFRVINITI